jgi:hypothetical protein
MVGWLAWSCLSFSCCSSSASPVVVNCARSVDHRRSRSLSLQLTRLGRRFVPIAAERRWRVKPPYPSKKIPEVCRCGRRRLYTAHRQREGGSKLKGSRSDLENRSLSFVHNSVDDRFIELIHSLPEFVASVSVSLFFVCSSPGR